MNSVKETNGEYEEEVLITPEIYYMLRHTDKLNPILELQGITFEFGSENGSVILRGRNRDNLEKIMEYFFNPDVNNFISIKIKDHEINEIFNGSPNNTLSNFNNDLADILETFSKSKLYKFIPKNKLEDKAFDGENVLIVFVEKSKKQELTNKINEFIRSKTCELTIKISQVPEENRLTLKKYLEIGKELAEFSETKSFVNLVKAIQSRTSPFNFTKEKQMELESKMFNYKQGYIPFIFVCASSGTGKTQLPFSVDIPMVYLINNKNLVRKDNSEKTQQIYKNFIDISKGFFECIEKDINIMGFNDENIGDKLDIMDTERLFLPSFMYSLVLNTKNSRKEGEHWVESQLSIEDGFRFSKMTINEARNNIDEIFGEDLKPVIFLDESQMGGSNNFRVEYIYTRKMIKKLDLIPIFMGTNASLENFVNIGTATIGSRLETEEKPWCYIIYRLAPTSIKYIEREKQKIITNSELNDNVRNAIDQMSRLMKKERPLFCHLVFNYVVENMKRWMWREVDLFEFIEDVLNAIWVNFTTRKLITSNMNKDRARQYNFNNITMMLTEYWEKELQHQSNKNKKIDGSGRQLDSEKANAIHNHIGHLYVNEEVIRELRESVIQKEGENNEVNFIPIFDSMTILNTTGGSIGNFEAYHVFGAFSDETIGELVFINRRNQDNILLDVEESVEKNIVYRTSVVNAVKEINKKYKLFPGVPVSNVIKWASLEIISGLSCLIASQCSGFRGSRFEDWLSCFVRNMSKKSGVSIKCDDDDELYKMIFESRIPFCSSSLGAKWNESFAEYLIRNGADLGITHAELGNKESRDFYIKRIGDDSAVISGECKYRDGGIDSRLVEEVIVKLVKFKSKINLIIVNKISDNHSSLKNVKCSKNIGLCKLKRKKTDRDEVEYMVEVVKKPRNIDEDTVVFMVIEIGNVMNP